MERPISRFVDQGETGKKFNMMDEINLKMAQDAKELKAAYNDSQMCELVKRKILSGQRGAEDESRRMMIFFSALEKPNAWDYLNVTHYTVDGYCASGHVGKIGFGFCFHPNRIQIDINCHCCDIHFGKLLLNNDLTEYRIARLAVETDEMLKAFKTQTDTHYEYEFISATDIPIAIEAFSEHIQIEEAKQVVFAKYRQEEKEKKEEQEKKEKEEKWEDIVGPSNGEDVKEQDGNEKRKNKYMRRKIELLDSSLVFKRVARMCIAASDFYSENDDWLNSHWQHQKVVYGMLRVYTNFDDLMAYLGCDLPANRCCSLVPDLTIPVKEMDPSALESFLRDGCCCLLLPIECAIAKNLGELLRMGWDKLTHNGTQF